MTKRTPNLKAKAQQVRSKTCTPCAVKRFTKFIIAFSFVLGLAIFTSDGHTQEALIKFFHSAEYALNSVLLLLIIFLEG